MKRDKKKIIFFIDYNNQSGNGHLFRCLILKEIFSKKEMFFLNCKKKVPEFIKKIKVIPGDIFQIVPRYKKDFFDYGIVDSYEINYNQEIMIKSICNKVIFIDDKAKRKTVSDIVINYSPFIKKINYRNLVNKNTKLLLGNKYNFISNQIGRYYDHKKIDKQSKNKLNLFFYFGTKNRLYILKKLLNSIKKTKSINTIFIVSNYKINKFKNFKIKNYKFLNKDKFLNLMLKSHIVILSSGIALLEAISMRKMIFSSYISDNQKTNYFYSLKKKYLFPISKFKNIINLPVKKIFEMIIKIEKNKISKPVYSLNNIKQKIDSYQ